MSEGRARLKFHYEHSSNNHSGGMGAGVSNWRLAKGSLPAGPTWRVSGDGIGFDSCPALTRWRPGQPHARRVLSISVPEIAERIWQKYYIPGGKAEMRLTRACPKHLKDAPQEQLNFRRGQFVEVILAREGHGLSRGGINSTWKSLQTTASCHRLRRLCSPGSGVCLDGRGRAAQDSGGARSLHPSRAGNLSPPGHRGAPDRGMTTRQRWACRTEGQFPPGVIFPGSPARNSLHHCQYVGDNPAQEGRRKGGWLRVE